WADPGGNSVPSRRPLTPASSRKLLQPRAGDSRDRRLQKPGSGGPLETGHGPPRARCLGLSVLDSVAQEVGCGSRGRRPAFFRRRFPTPVADIHPAKGTRPRWLHAPRRPAPLGWVALKAGDCRSPHRRPLPPELGSGRV
ncbi:unnamed protein product, partial [Ixodes persulcatus]